MAKTSRTKPTSPRSVLAWHFLKEAKLPHGDNRSVLVGSTLSIDPPIKACERGLHGSRRLIDALGYAPGSILCRTEHTGTIIEQPDKICSQHRKVLWMGDIERLLHEFACNEAELALAARRKEGIKIPEACDYAIKVKRLWLDKKASADQLSTAESAARRAAESTARSAARSAAESAAESAAQSAAWSTARRAAWSAAWSAAESAAWSAAWSDQNSRLEKAVRKFMRETPNNA